MIAKTERRKRETAYSRMSVEQLDKKIEQIAGDVAEYQRDYDRALELYREEPTTLHDANVKEKKRYLKWAEGQLRAARAERDSRRD